jgi:hypothetical protein
MENQEMSDKIARMYQKYHQLSMIVEYPPDYPEQWQKLGEQFTLFGMPGMARSCYARADYYLKKQRSESDDDKR